jgi:hypothetical protein
MAPQGPPAVNQQPPPPSPATSGRGSPLFYKPDDEEDPWSPKIRSPSPLVSSKPNPLSTPSSSRPNPPVTPHRNPSGNYWDYARDHGLVKDPVFGVPIPLPPGQSPVSGNMTPFLRWSRRIRQPVFRPDNVYGNQPPVDILAEGDDDDASLWPRDQSPSPSGTSSKPSKSAGLMKIVQDGGAGLMNFLLSAAVSSADAKKKIPEVSKVREWHYRDLMRLPKATQEEWKIACKEELEALCWCNVFKLTDLPKGCKTIGCRWVLLDFETFNQKRLTVSTLSIIQRRFAKVEDELCYSSK